MKFKIISEAEPETDNGSQWKLIKQATAAVKTR